MDILNVKRILGRYFWPRGATEGSDRRELTPKEKMKRKSRNRMARASRRRNRRR